jgi:hypothetical protein
MMPTALPAGVDTPDVTRAYRDSDADALWELKRGFELNLATGTGDDAKEDSYREKLDADYRPSYLAWVDRCVAETPRAVQVAERDGDLVEPPRHRRRR